MIDFKLGRQSLPKAFATYANSDARGRHYIRQAVFTK
jgi:hypothetical protein